MRVCARVRVRVCVCARARACACVCMYVLVVQVETGWDDVEDDGEDEGSGVSWVEQAKLMAVEEAAKLEYVPLHPKSYTLFPFYERTRSVRESERKSQAKVERVCARTRERADGCARGANLTHVPRA